MTDRPMSGSPARQRRSARVILLSPEDDVLLIEFVVARSDGAFVFWATPGGAVEAREADMVAAQRELREELGLMLDVVGPVHTSTAEFEHEGAMVVSTDVFFLARCARDAPLLQGVSEAERAAMRTLRWWSLDEIEAALVAVFPEDLAAVVSRLIASA